MSFQFTDILILSGILRSSRCTRTSWIFWWVRYKIYGKVPLFHGAFWFTTRIAALSQTRGNRFGVIWSNFFYSDPTHRSGLFNSIVNRTLTPPRGKVRRRTCKSITPSNLIFVITIVHKGIYSKWAEPHSQMVYFIMGFWETFTLLTLLWGGRFEAGEKAAKERVLHSLKVL